MPAEEIGEDGYPQRDAHQVTTAALAWEVMASVTRFGCAGWAGNDTEAASKATRTC